YGLRVRMGQVPPDINRHADDAQHKKQYQRRRPAPQPAPPATGKHPRPGRPTPHDPFHPVDKKFRRPAPPYASPLIHKIPVTAGPRAKAPKTAGLPRKRDPPSSNFRVKLFP